MIKIVLILLAVLDSEQVALFQLFPTAQTVWFRLLGLHHLLIVRGNYKIHVKEAEH